MTRRREARLRLGLRLDTGVGVSIIDVAVGIRVCGWVRLGGHDPGEGREGRVDKERRMGAAGACIAHVKNIFLNVGSEGEGSENDSRRKRVEIGGCHREKKS